MDTLCEEHGQPKQKICTDDHLDRRLGVDCQLDSHQQVTKIQMPSTQELSEETICEQRDQYFLLPKRCGQMPFRGLYRDGMKIGKWLIKVGDKTYDEKRGKYGLWIETYSTFSEIIYPPTYPKEYRKRVKLGKWMTKPLRKKKVLQILKIQYYIMIIKT